jgi:hypothetical protein
MASTPTTDSKFREPDHCQIDIRVYRRSDKCYWTCQIRLDRPIVQAMAMLHVWTSGLSIHPNLESVVVDGIRVLPTTGFSFNDYASDLRKFLDDKISNNHSQ